MAQMEATAPLEIRCESFLVGIGPFQAPQETSQISEEIRGVVERYRKLVGEVRILCTTVGIDHWLTESALDFLPCDFLRVPADLSKLRDDLRNPAMGVARPRTTSPVRCSS
ncbi:MAG TPA: hypothetical protein VHU91_06465 [Mycobacteriales bacterium]|jgi:hypothetical protein|nr:hypothetical protein [Mycobacteriales bacterium]